MGVWSEELVLEVREETEMLQVLRTLRAGHPLDMQRGEYLGLELWHTDNSRASFAVFWMRADGTRRLWWKGIGSPQGDDSRGYLARWEEV